MKRVFLFMVALVTSAMMMATDFKLTSADPVTRDEITVTFAQGEGTTQPTWYDAGLRLYSKNTITITSDNAITAISFNWEKQDTKTFAAATADCGDYSHPNDAGTGTWTGSSNKVVITVGSDGRLQLNTFSVKAGEPRVLKGIYINGKAAKLLYTEGEEFAVDSFKVMGQYEDDKGDRQITSDITWICEPKVMSIGTTSVNVKATVGKFTSEAITVNDIVVNKATYANTYSSNVEFKENTDTKASAAEVIINKNTYKAIKCGTSSVAGSCMITIPAATKTLHFHAAGWSGKAVTIEVNGTSYNAPADAGMANNSPFTLKNDPEKTEYFTFDPQGATEITFTAAKENRFILFGVNAEFPEDYLSAPMISAVSTEFDNTLEVTLSCETKDAKIYFTLDGTTPTSSSTLYESPITLDATTTIKAIAIKDEKSSDVAEKTYVKTLFSSLEELLTLFPATSNKATVTVTLTDVVIDSILNTNKAIFTYVKGTLVELYGNVLLPTTWQVGGTISGTITAQWNLYSGIPELQNWTTGQDKWGVFTYKDPVVRQLESIAIEGEATVKSYVEGQTFDPAGLKVTGKYTGESEYEQINRGITWSFDPEAFALGDDSVTVVASVDGISSDPFVVKGITVGEFIRTYANTYSSNVDLVANADTKASEAEVEINKKKYDAIKCGTSSVAGSCTITIPAATKTLHFHAAGWSGKAVTIEVNGTSYNAPADAGMANSTPFTLQNDPEKTEYFTFDPQGATEITFTAAKENRFILFGVNTELQEGVIAVPLFDIKESYFDQEITVTLSCETEGGEIYYALNEEVTPTNGILYTEPIKLTDTQTIYAVVRKEGKESEQVNKTYSLAPAYNSLDELVEAGKPTAEGRIVVLVLNNDEIIDISSNGKEISGLYLMSNSYQDVEIYQSNYAFPNAWEIGGTVSGRIMGKWKLFGKYETWELEISKEQVKNLIYSGPTGIDEIKPDGTYRKALYNGHLLIIKGEHLYDAQGRMVK